MQSLRALALCLGLLCILPAVLSLTVHLVPHTHDDVGWLKTVDQYFIGSNNSLQHASVNNLITATLAALRRNPERKFIYVEQAFFQRWWRQQSDETKSQLRELVNKGQWEFINGGWCMHDEATTHYIDMIDQTTLGHQYILTEFGAAANPTIGWQIDPFGHSATQAALLSAEVGFDALFFGRIDYQDFDLRAKNKEFQFNWAPSPSLGPNAKVWTEVALDGNYNPPGSFCWDYLCGSEDDNPQVQDRDDLEDKNVEQRVADFIKAAYYMASFRKGDIATMNLQWNMGSDFNYENAERYFTNMDKIIAAVNRNGTVKAMYSTPSIYYKARQAEGIEWSTKTDDFFPYATGPGNQWTGYFTSRPGVKRYVRDSSVLLQAARQLEVFSGASGNGTEASWEALGVAQHHDAVSGTERQHVAYDYAMRIATGNAAVYETISSAVSALAGGASWTSCPLLNVSQCSVIQSANDAATVLLYNPQARAVQQAVTLPLFSANSVKVTDSTGATVRADVVPVPQTEATAGGATKAVSFTATVAGLGWNTYTITPSKPATSTRLRKMSPAAAPRLQKPADDFVILENDLVAVTFSNTTGLFSSWTDKSTGTTHAFTQNFYWYQPSEDGNYGTSDSYTFQVANNTGANLVSTQPPTLTVYKGDHVQIVHQQWNDWVQQTTRVYVDGTEPVVEVEWTVGPVDTSDGVSKEVFTKYFTDVESRSVVYTDSNSREFQRRVRNARPSFNRTLDDPIASNYYPLTSAAYLQDDSSLFAVLVDRAEGAASLQDGNLEVMLHRRLLCPCGFDENLNETDAAVYRDVRGQGITVERVGRGLIVTGKHRLYFGAQQATLDSMRLAQNHLYYPLLPVLAATTSLTAPTKGSGSFLQTALPANVELISLHKLIDGRTVLRLSHSFAVEESDKYSGPVTVDLATLFSQPIASVEQITLTANAAYQPGVRNGGVGLSVEEYEREAAMRAGLDGTQVTLYPMQILTFAISY